MGRWQYDRATFDAESGRLTLHNVKRLANSDGFVEFMELVDYVRQYVHRETKGEQTPWLSRKELFGDLPVRMAGAG